MSSNPHPGTWPGSLEAVAGYEAARGTAEELLRQLHDHLQIDEDDGEIHWGRVGKICRINALLAEAIRVLTAARL